MPTTPLQPSNAPCTINILPNESIDHGKESLLSEVCSDILHCKSRLSIFYSKLIILLQQQQHQSSEG